ncbi:MAG TPA: hypothetical protein VIL20_10165 [Sandaracinaceae bacterium]
MSAIRLLSALEEAQLRRLEPRLYHLVLSRRPPREVARALERAIEDDAAPEPYAMLVEPLAGLRDLAIPRALILPRAVHVAVVSRSPLAAGISRAATAFSKLAGGPRIVCYASLEAAFAAARRALEHRRGWSGPN